MTADSVYLDYAATTPLAPEVREAMLACLDSVHLAANPASLHVAGRRSASAVQHAREQVADLLHTRPDCLLWTSGATESNNLAIQGAARARAHRGRHLITMSTEHKAVVDTFRALEKDGFEVTWLTPESNGLLNLAALLEAFRSDTQLVSIMHVNNESGVVQDICQIGALCRERNILFHSDAAQSAGKIDIDLNAWPIDLLSLTAHKFYGPQGVGALYIANRPGGTITPLMFGGSQEQRLRPGTLPVQLIVGMGRAAALAQEKMRADATQASDLNQRLWTGLKHIDGVVRNGAPQDCYPGVLNVSIADIEGESLILGMEPVCVAQGSACNSASGEASHVLRAMGRSDRLAQSAVRFSFGRLTTEADIDYACARYAQAVQHLRSIAPAKRDGT